MSLVTSFLIAGAANLDNGGVGVAYGLRKIRIPIGPNILIAAVAAGGALVFGLIGERAATLLPLWADSWIGAFVIIGVGVWVLIGDAMTRRVPRGPFAGVLAKPATADADHSGDISLRESLLLSVALGINAWAGGLGAGLLGLGLWPVVAGVGIMSMLMLAVGVSLGSDVLGRLLGTRATLMAGLLLIGIGIKQLL